MRAHPLLIATARTLGVVVLGWGSLAGAQTVAVQPAPPSVAVTSGVAQAAPPPAPAQPPSTWVIANSGATTAVPEPAFASPGQPVLASPGQQVTRPNRSMLMTGMFTFGPAYVASISIAAASTHYGDANLWIPVFGPWLDLGARPSCPSTSDCTDNGNRVLLVIDGALQTFGAFQLVAAFIWPETITVPLSSASRASMSFTAGTIGRRGYGLAAVGRF
jgi:hypothetical protein